MQYYSVDMLSCCYIHHLIVETSHLYEDIVTFSKSHRVIRLGYMRCISNMRRILMYKYIWSIYIHGLMYKREFVNISFGGGSLMKGSSLFRLGGS
jgi:hypothetical protein